jgi:hypothetical protein
VSARAAGVGLALALGLLAWRLQLVPLSHPGEGPRPLEPRASGSRAPANVDVVLPGVPTGLEPLRSGDRVLLVHYWAPWERHAAAQAALLDSLRRMPGLEALHVVVVCFDPFPSVARYVARHRLRLDVRLDHAHDLRRALPCPGVPFTYVLDRSGGIAVAQGGVVDWLAPRTRAALDSLLAE